MWIRSLLSSIWLKIGALLAAAIWIFAVAFRFVKLGRDAAEAEQARRDAAARAKAREVTNEVDELGPADVDRRLDKWMRDGE